MWGLTRIIMSIIILSGLILNTAGKTITNAKTVSVYHEPNPKLPQAKTPTSVPPDRFELPPLSNPLPVRHFSVVVSQPRLASTRYDRPIQCNSEPPELSTQLAQLKPGYELLDSADYGWQFGSYFNQPVVLELLTIIDGTGKPEMLPDYPPKVLQGTSRVDYTQLAGAIIQKLQFEPTYSECKPVAQVYYLKLIISPELP